MDMIKPISAVFPALVRYGFDFTPLEFDTRDDGERLHMVTSLTCRPEGHASTLKKVTLAELLEHCCAECAKMSSFHASIGVNLKSLKKILEITKVAHNFVTANLYPGVRVLSSMHSGYKYETFKNTLEILKTVGGGNFTSWATILEEERVKRIEESVALLKADDMRSLRTHATDNFFNPAPFEGFKDYDVEYANAIDGVKTKFFEDLTEVALLLPSSAAEFLRDNEGISGFPFLLSAFIASGVELETKSIVYLPLSVAALLTQNFEIEYVTLDEPLSAAEKEIAETLYANPRQADRSEAFSLAMSLARAV